MRKIEANAFIFIFNPNFRIFSSLNQIYNTTDINFLVSLSIEYKQSNIIYF